MNQIPTAKDAKELSDKNHRNKTLLTERCITMFAKAVNEGIESGAYETNLYCIECFDNYKELAQDKGYIVTTYRKVCFTPYLNVKWDNPEKN